MEQPQTQTTPHMPKQHSLLGLMARGAAGLAIAGAIVGGLLGAAALGGIGAVNLGVAADIVKLVPGIGEVLVGSGLTSAGGAALAGAGGGAMVGALAGVPAGMVAGPMSLKQKQTEAMIPLVAQQSFAKGQESGIEAGKKLAHEAHEFNNGAAKTGHAEALLAERATKQQTQGHGATIS